MTCGEEVEHLEELTNLLTAMGSPGNHCKCVAALAGFS